MAEKSKQKLLKDKRVVDEIQRHLWIESEKAGRDIGFETAAEDWLKNFSKAWLEYNLPNQTKQQSKASVASPENQKKNTPKAASSAGNKKTVKKSAARKK